MTPELLYANLKRGRDGAPCHFCGVGFVSGRSRANHERIVHGPLPEAVRLERRRDRSRVRHAQHRVEEALQQRAKRRAEAALRMTASRTWVGRFLEKVDPNPTTHCWEWMGNVSANGYGRVRVGGLQTAAHRWAYRAYVGEIPDGLQLDHLCRNTRCVNPDHLEPVTGRENMLRAFDHACRNGHRRRADNFLVQRDGYRRCLDCVKETA